MRAYILTIRDACRRLKSAACFKTLIERVGGFHVGWLATTQ